MKTIVGPRAEAVIEALNVATERSWLGRLWLRLQRGVQAIESSERVRLFGLLVVTATFTQGLLLPAVPVMARPAAPAWLRVVILAGGLLLIVLARPIALAWPGSTLRRLLRRM